MIEEGRVAVMLAELDAAGDAWHAVPAAWPERHKLRPGRRQGEAWIRPAVILDDEHPRFPAAPVVLLRDEQGRWWHKGTRQGE